MSTDHEGAEKILNMFMSGDYAKVSADTEIKTPVELREALADYAHEAWSGWMKYMFSKMHRNDDGTVTMPKWAADRWSGQMNTNYCDLPEDMKPSDREEANKMIAIFNQHNGPGG